MKRRVLHVDFAGEYAHERDEIIACVDRIFSGGRFVGGPEITTLEGELAAYCGAEHVVALGSGTAAIALGLRLAGVGPGDEVITVANSFVATAGAIVELGARPVFVDIADDLNIDPALVEAAITPRTKALLPVHLTGRICDMDALCDIAGRHGLALVEDAAQAFGARHRGTSAGCFGIAGAFSTHPLKSLHAAGDAGFLVTGDAELAARARRYRNHGQIDRDNVIDFGANARMDVLQAAILRMRLPKLERVHEGRRRNAELYRQLIRAEEIELPQCRPHEFNIYHTFIVQTDRRDGLQAFLAARGIDSLIHYPIPIHLQPAARTLDIAPGSLPNTERQARRILSLPVSHHLGEEDIAYVAGAVNDFFAGRPA